MGIVSIIGTAAKNSSPQDSIATLLAAIGAATHATGVALLSASEGRRPRLVQATPRFGDAMLEALDTAFAEIGPLSMSQWLQGATGEAILVTRIDGAADERLLLALDFGLLSPPLREAADRTCRIMLPLLAAGLRLCQVSEQRDRRLLASDNALQAMNVGVVMVSRDGSIFYSNQAADKLLAAGRGIQSASGTLRAEHLSDGVAFHAALAHVEAAPRDDHIGAALLTFRRQKRPPLIASLISLDKTVAARAGAAAILYIVDPTGETAHGIPALCRLHNLSTVETALVCHLVRGDLIADAAQKMRIKETTARGYLKQIFVKTGTRRQTELVIRMLSSLIPLAETIKQETVPTIGEQDSPPAASSSNVGPAGARCAIAEKRLENFRPAAARTTASAIAPCDL